ncbi:FkbM family methyltransferase [Terricaulis silvestris]|uniref:FkbM family methyltransferase n=1 Tax=Terricaulis silvestris TaxID=2686094 RepID=UPI00131C1D3C|nr:FkbM family methyltransferase [Terricaulis silvestris]
MYVDLRSSIGRGVFATGEFDPEAIRPALDALTPGATYIDIGANIGVYAMLALDAVGPSGQIHCFEIDPRPLSALRKSISSFDLLNIAVHECAVSDVDGVLTFVPAAEHGHNRIDPAGRTGRSIRSIRIDTWAEERSLDRVDVIKIDVEGAEKSVIEGARGTIAKFRPLVLCEASAENTAPFGYSPEDLISLFVSLDYCASWLEGVHTPTLLAKPRAN